MHQMKASVVLLLLLALSQLLSYSGVQGFTWNDNVGADLRTCVGEQFTFEWNYTLDNTDMEISKEWNAVLNGQTVQLMLERPTEFLFEANGGLTLRSASLAHSGNYSLAVVVMVKTTGNIETMKYERSANLTVAEPPGTNGILQATQDRKAIYDNHTSMWHVTLSCGQFVSLGHPAIDVVWQTPSGRQSSSKYQDGRFYLQLPNPVEGGEYSCILPSTDPATSCLPDGSLLEAALVVDEMQVRLTLLEAENKDLKAENRDTKAAVKDLKAENTDMKAAVKDLKAGNTDMKAAVKDVKALVNINTATLDSLLFPVAFTATLKGGGRVTIGKHSPIKFDNVVTNIGNAYNSHTGEFTAPVAGTYGFFLAVKGDSNEPSLFAIYQSSKVLAVTKAYPNWSVNRDKGACFATTHLNLGNTVSVRYFPGYAGGTDIDRWYATSFSGFLITAD